MRWIPFALLLLTGAVAAEPQSIPTVKRGEAWYRQALAIEAEANRIRNPAERHQLLGRAVQANDRAMAWARQACRECCAKNRDAILSFYRKVSNTAWRLQRARSKFRASTDMEAQPIIRLAPSAAVRRQVSRRNELQRERRSAAETPANDRRVSRRAELNRWRRARVAQRLGAAARSPRANCR